MKGKTLAIDPGDKRIGIAISDPTGMVAFPLKVILHVSRDQDADVIVNIAVDQQVDLIVVGQSLDEEGQPTPSGRKAERLAGSIRSKTNIPVELWDESDSTNAAREARFEIHAPRKKRIGHMDEMAATVILQSYLDSQ
jgi:putative holliday junction resolvase